MRAVNKLVNPKDIKDDEDGEEKYDKEIIEQIDVLGRRKWVIKKTLKPEFQKESSQQDIQNPENEKQNQDEENEGNEEGDKNREQNSDNQAVEEEGQEEQEQELLPLQKRTESLNLDKFVGKRKLIQVQGDLKSIKDVYYCDVCKVGCKDSLTFLDHLNGRSHNKLLGMSMVVEKVSVDKIKQKFESLKQLNKSQKQQQSQAKAISQKLSGPISSKLEVIKKKLKPNTDEQIEKLAKAYGIQEEQQKDDLNDQGNLKSQEENKNQDKQKPEITESNAQSNLHNSIQTSSDDNKKLISLNNQSAENPLLESEKPKSKKHKRKAKANLNLDNEGEQEDDDDNDEEIQQMKQLGLPINFTKSNKKKQ